MSHNLSVLFLALLARVWSNNLSALYCWPCWQGCGEMSHNLSELFLALLAKMWRDEPPSVRAVVGPAG
jgi:hypothetical protein